MTRLAKRKRATLHDVARHASVSYQTVSRVINDSPHVSDATRERVLEAVRLLDFQPNHAAKALVTNQTRLLGLVTFGLSQYGPAQMVRSIERVARLRGYRTLYSNIEAFAPEEVNNVVDHMSRWSVDGVAVISPVSHPVYADLVGALAAFPVVQIGVNLDGARPSVAIDQRAGAQAVIRHLLAAGHRRIAMLQGPSEWYDARLRSDGVAATLAEHGLELCGCEAGDWTAASGYQAVQRLLAKGCPLTALFTANDQMALGAILALREGGLAIPERVAVVGFDDIPEAAYFDPPLTTVRQDFDSLGMSAVEVLIALVETPETPIVPRILAPQLIIRRSG